MTLLVHYDHLCEISVVYLQLSYQTSAPSCLYRLRKQHYLVNYMPLLMDSSCVLIYPYDEKQQDTPLASPQALARQLALNSLLLWLILWILLCKNSSFGYPFWDLQLSHLQLNTSILTFRRLDPIRKVIHHLKQRIDFLSALNNRLFWHSLSGRLDSKMDLSPEFTFFHA